MDLLFRNIKFFCVGYLLLWLLLYCFRYWPVLFWYPFCLWSPGEGIDKFLEIFKLEFYGWKEVLDVEKSFLFAVIFIILFSKSSPKRSSESAGTFFLIVWYWLSSHYTIWSCLFYSRLVFTWLGVLVNLCNHDLLCLYFYLGWQHLNFCNSLILVMH